METIYQCSKCNWKHILEGLEFSFDVPEPHRGKLLCSNCGAFIKWATKQEVEDTFDEY